MVIVKSVYAYNDYRKYIADYYNEQKQLVGFSWRNFAKAAKIGSPVFLKLVCEGKSGLSKKTSFNVAEAMGLEGFEKEYFSLLVLYNQAKNVKAKSEAFKSLQEIVIENRVLILDKSLFEYYSTWLNSTIRELASSVNNATPHGLAKLCTPAVSDEAVAQALKFLTKNKLLRKSTIKGRYTLGRKSISTGSLPTSVMSVRNLHRQMGQLALESLDAIPVSERNFSTITLGLTEKAYRDILIEMQNFRKKVIDIATKDPQTERVYELNLQLFPLSKKIPGELQKTGPCNKTVKRNSNKKPSK